MSKDQRVLVVGCGIIGLSSGITLQSDYTVDIWAKDLPPFTTSNKAGAYWFPSKASPIDKVKKWSLETRRLFQDYYSKIPDAAIHPATFHYLHQVQSDEDFLFSSVIHLIFLFSLFLFFLFFSLSLFLFFSLFSSLADPQKNRLHFVFKRIS